MISLKRSCESLEQTDKIDWQGSIIKDEINTTAFTPISIGPLMFSLTLSLLFILKQNVPVFKAKIILKVESGTEKIFCCISFANITSFLTITQIGKI